MKTKTAIIAILMAVFLAISGTARAQRSVRIMGSIFLSPAFKYTQIKGQNAYFYGAKGGFIIKRKYVLSVFAYSLANKLKNNYFLYDQKFYSHFQDLDDDVIYRPRIYLKYGGFELGYMKRFNKKVTATFATILGAGSIKNQFDRMKYDIVINTGEQNFLILEPELRLGYDLLDTVRLESAVSYRKAYDIRLEGVRTKEVSGISFSFYVNIDILE